MMHEALEIATLFEQVADPQVREARHTIEIVHAKLADLLPVISELYPAERRGLAEAILQADNGASTLVSATESCGPSNGRQGVPQTTE